MTRSIVHRYYEAQWPYNAETLAELRHPEWVMEWPQSGERIVGHDNDRAISEQYPGYPRHVLLGAAGKEEEWGSPPPRSRCGSREAGTCGSVNSGSSIRTASGTSTPG